MDSLSLNLKSRNIKEILTNTESFLAKDDSLVCPGVRKMQRRR